jgi:hypothetical protein
MATLTHEVWEELTDSQLLHTCCLAGPRGDACRRKLGPTARLVSRFEAGSHFEAMSWYHRFLDREVYTSDQAWDYQPYPDEWLAEQEGRV